MKSHHKKKHTPASRTQPSAKQQVKPNAQPRPTSGTSNAAPARPASSSPSEKGKGFQRPQPAPWPSKKPRRSVAFGTTRPALPKSTILFIAAFLVGAVILFFGIRSLTSIPATATTAPATATTAPATATTAPATAAPATAAPATATAAPATGYVVQNGDTCDKIARRLNVRTEDLMTLNGMQGRCLIRAGQVLRIPTGTVPTRTVAPTRTLVPTRTTIPTRTTAPTRTPVPTRTPSPTVDPATGYVVQNGDTCDKIARRLNVRTEDFMSLNGMQGRCLIRAGQVLRIPTGTVPTRTVAPTRTLVPTRTTIPTRTATATVDPAQGYVVRVGDTCSEIAKAFKVRVIDLRQANGLDERCLLAPGRVLKVPSP
jgi:LysM repeat protein